MARLATFPFNRVILGWTEGVQLMVEGEKTRFWIPEALAYNGQGPVYNDLVSDIELIQNQRGANCARWIEQSLAQCQSLAAKPHNVPSPGGTVDPPTTRMISPRRLAERSISALESWLVPVRMQRMKTQLLARIVLVGVAALLLQACATTTPSGPAALAGTWTNSLGTVWTMNTDGSFDVHLNHDGKRDAWGKCTIEGNTVTIVGTGGTVPEGCAKTTGVYQFTRGKDALHFTLVKDACKERVKNVTLDWKKK